MPTFFLQLPHHDINPFSFIASFNMARDASDQAFHTALQVALPRIAYVPHIDVSMEGELDDGMGNPLLKADVWSWFRSCNVSV